VSLAAGVLAVSRMFEFGLIMCLGKASWAVWSCRFAFGFDPRVLPGWVVLFFVTVNQVLVRLWARVIGISPSGLVEVPSFG
jgi:hypothetical protein